MTTSPGVSAMFLRSVTVALALLVPFAASAAKDPAQTKTEQMIAAFKAVKPGAGEAVNAKAYKSLDTLIDYDTITAKAIEPRVAKFSPAQKAQFQKQFRELIRMQAYPDSGDFFRRAKLTYKPVTAEGGTSNVPFRAYVAAEDLETNVTLHWGKAPDGSLKMVDVSFDGDSLVRDYQNQFAKVLDKDGVAGLFKKLDERRAALQKGAAAPATK
jgi:phospholipid transport system substrate-binding protein